MEEPVSKCPRVSQRNCPHCNEIISYKTYRRHKRLFYNSTTNSWFGLFTMSPITPEASENLDVQEVEDELPPLDFGTELMLPHEESPPCSEPALSETDSEDGEISRFVVY